MGVAGGCQKTENPQLPTNKMPTSKSQVRDQELRQFPYKVLTMILMSKRGRRSYLDRFSPSSTNIVLLEIEKLFAQYSDSMPKW